MKKEQMHSDKMVGGKKVSGVAKKHSSILTAHDTIFVCLQVGYAYIFL